MHTKTLTSAVGAAVLAAAVTTVLSTSALAQTPGEAEGIVVSSEAFDAVKGWLGDTEENSTFKEFLVEGEGGDTLTQWLATVQGLRDYISPQQFLSEQFPDRAKELEEFAADEGWNYADPRTLALHMLAADEDLFDRWEERVALKHGLGLESFAQSRALPEFTKWRGTLSIPAETTSLDEWMSARGLDVNQVLRPPRPPLLACRCQVLVNFAGTEPMSPLATHEVVVNKKKDKQERWTNQFMGAHRGQLYLYARGYRRGVDKETLHRTNKTAIRFVNLCTSLLNRPCEGCYTKVHPYGRYGARVHANTNTWGLFGGKSEAGATDAVQLKLDTYSGKLTLIDKGVAISQTSERELKLSEIKDFVAALAAFAKFDISDPVATTNMTVELIRVMRNLFQGWRQQSDNQKDMFARYDSVLSEDSDFIMPANQWWTLELTSDGSIAYSGEGRHETNQTWYASGAGLAVGLEGFICPRGVAAPARVGAWAHSQVESSPFESSTILRDNVSNFLGTVMFVAPPDTTANRGARSW